MSDDLPKAARKRRSRRSLTCQGIDQAILSQDRYGRWVDYWRLIDTLRSQTDLFSPCSQRRGGSGSDRIARACARLAHQPGRWLRLPEFWVPATTAKHIAHLQWCDFVGHLLHAYDTPAFFAPMWLQVFHD